jgi:hypothetical protein
VVVDNVPFQKIAGVEEAIQLLVQASATCRRILQTLTPIDVPMVTFIDMAA